MEPATKSPHIAELLEGFCSQTSAIEANRCVDEPIGCGKPVIDFKDDASADEYRRSGLCQICQDSFYGS